MLSEKIKFNLISDHS